MGIHFRPWGWPQLFSVWFSTLVYELRMLLPIGMKKAALETKVLWRDAHSVWRPRTWCVLHYRKQVGDVFCRFSFVDAYELYFGGDCSKPISGSLDLKAGDGNFRFSNLEWEPWPIQRTFDKRCCLYSSQARKSQGICWNRITEALQKGWSRPVGCVTRDGKGSKVTSSLWMHHFVVPGRDVSGVHF